MSRAPCLVSHVTCPMSRVSCHVPYVSCLMSRALCHVSHVTCPMSRVSCHVPYVACLMSHAPFPVSHVTRRDAELAEKIKYLNDHFPTKPGYAMGCLLSSCRVRSHSSLVIGVSQPGLRITRTYVCERVGLRIIFSHWTTRSVTVTCPTATAVCDVLTCGSQSIYWTRNSASERLRCDSVD